MWRCATAPEPAAPRAARLVRGDRGSVLLALLLVLSLAGVIGGCLVALSAGETVFAAHWRALTEARCAAESAAEYAVAELTRAPDWNAVLAGLAGSAFADADAAPRLVDHTALDLARLDAEVQVARGSAADWGPDTPRWVRYVWGPLAQVWPGEVTSPFYVVAWVADDPFDGDGDPLVDTNGLVQVRAEAFGGLGTRRAAVAVIARRGSGPGPVRRVAWRAVD